MPAFDQARITAATLRGHSVKVLPEQVLALWQQGLRAAEIGRREGVSRERVRQILTRFGINYKQVQRERTAAKRAEERAEAQARREQENARCAECGAVLTRKPRLNGLPSWCSGKEAPLACRQAYYRWSARTYYSAGPGREYSAAYRQRDSVKAAQKIFSRRSYEKRRDERRAQAQTATAKKHVQGQP